MHHCFDCILVYTPIHTIHVHINQIDISRQSRLFFCFGREEEKYFALSVRMLPTCFGHSPFSSSPLPPSPSPLAKAKFLHHHHLSFSILFLRVFAIITITHLVLVGKLDVEKERCTFFLFPAFSVMTLNVPNELAPHTSCCIGRRT